MAKFPPSTMRAWQYNTASGGLEKNLKLNTVPLPTPNPTQNLVQIIAASLNPVDYKPAEVGLLSWLLIPKPATPGLDFVGRVVEPASKPEAGKPTLEKGQIVFGAAGKGPFAGGALRDFALVEAGAAVPVPSGVDLIDASTVPVASLTAYQTIVPRVKKGDKIFINGGSGGTGMFGIQIAKTIGCYVATSCSTPNVELCKSLGADFVADYKKGSVVDQLKKTGVIFDHVVDNVGSDTSLYWRCHEYTTPKAAYIDIAGEPSFRYLFKTIKRRVWPGFLGGGKRKVEGFLTQPSVDELTQIGKWMQEGKVKTVIDSVWPMEEAPKAFEKLKTRRARGKIVVDVASKTWKSAGSV